MTAASCLIVGPKSDEKSWISVIGSLFYLKQQFVKTWKFS